MNDADSLEFRVELWDDADFHVVELVALANNMVVSRGAYEAAVKMRPGANLAVYPG